MKNSYFKLIIIALLFLGVGVYAWNVDTQIKLQKEKQAAELAIQQREIDLKEESEKTKAEQGKKEYIAKRKNECYEIEKSERDKFNNIDSSEYMEEEDTCIVRYTTDQYKGVDCRTEYKNDLSTMFQCAAGIFTKEF